MCILGIQNFIVLDLLVDADLSYPQPVGEVAGVCEGGGEAHEPDRVLHLCGDEPHATYNHLLQVTPTRHKVK